MIQYIRGGPAPFLVLVAALYVRPAQAHSGGTDANGCHSGKRVYHCHGSGSYTPSRTFTPAPRIGDEGVNPPSRCQGAKFADPTNPAYTYCKRADGDYEVFQNGERTGTAKKPGEAWYAIDRASRPVQAESPAARTEEKPAKPVSKFRDLWAIGIAFLVGVVPAALACMFALGKTAADRLAILLWTFTIGPVLSIVTLVLTGGTLGLPAFVLVWGLAWCSGTPLDALSPFGWILVPYALTVGVLSPLFLVDQ